MKVSRLSPRTTSSLGLPIAVLVILALVAVACGTASGPAAPTTAPATGGSTTGGSTTGGAPTAAPAAPTTGAAATEITSPTQAAAPTSRSAAGGPAAGSCPSSEQKFKGQKLVVATYGGGTGEAFKNAVTPLFEKCTGASIEWNTSGSALEWVPQLAAAKGGTPPYDVIFTEDLTQLPAIDQGVVFKPNYNNIPNIALAAPEVKPDSGYGVTWGSFRFGLAYLPDKFKAAGIPAPKNMSAIWDPKLAGHVAIPDITQSNWPHYMNAFAVFLGHPVDNPAPTLSKLKEIKDPVLYSSSSDLEARMTSGEIWAALWIDGRVNRLKAGGLNIEFGSLGIPKPGGGTYDYIGSLGIMDLTNPDKQALADEFFNAMLDTDAQTEMSKKTTYGAINLQAQENVEKDPKIGPLVDPDLGKQYRPDLSKWQAVQQKWIDAWGRTFRK